MPEKISTVCTLEEEEIMGGSYFTKREVKQYFRAIIGALNECEIFSSPCPRIEGGQIVRGWYLSGVITIQNTPRTENVLLALIHEALHHIRGGRTEQQTIVRRDIPSIECDALDLLAAELFVSFTTDQIRALESYLPRPNETVKNSSSKKRKGKKKKNQSRCKKTA